MSGNGTAHGPVIPTFAPRTLAATSPPGRVQIDGDALPEGATPTEKAAIMRGLVIRPTHGTYAIRRAPGVVSTARGRDRLAQMYARVL
jgi:hypothetical protein